MNDDAADGRGATEVGWLTTLEPTWVRFSADTATRVLLQSRKTENKRHYESPDGLFASSRTYVKHRMETMLIFDAGSQQLKDFRELVAWEGRTFSVSLRDTADSPKDDGTTEAYQRRRILIDDVDYGSVGVIDRGDAWETLQFETSIMNALMPDFSSGRLYASLTARGIELPPDALSLSWASIGGYVSGRRRLLGSRGV